MNNNLYITIFFPWRKNKNHFDSSKSIVLKVQVNHYFAKNKINFHWKSCEIFQNIRKKRYFAGEINVVGQNGT